MTIPQSDTVGIGARFTNDMVNGAESAYPVDPASVNLNVACQTICSGSYMDLIGIDVPHQVLMQLVVTHIQAVARFVDHLGEVR